MKKKWIKSNFKFYFLMDTINSLKNEMKRDFNNDIVNKSKQRKNITIIIQWGSVITIGLTLIIIILSPKLRLIFDIDFSIHQFIVFIGLYLLIIFGLLKWVVFINRTKKTRINDNDILNDYDSINNASTNVSFVLIFLLSVAFIIFLFVIPPVENKYFGSRAKKLDKNKGGMNQVGILITKFKPIKNQFLVNQNFYDFDFSSIIFKKMLQINKNDSNEIRFIGDTIIRIEYYDKYYEIKKVEKFEKIYESTRYVAILMGEIIEEENNFNIQNSLFIISTKIKDRLEYFKDYFKLGNKDNINDQFKYLSIANPRDYMDYLASDFKSQPKELPFEYLTSDFNIEIKFPVVFSFSSSLENTPYIVFNYIRFLLDLERFKSKSLGGKLVTFTNRSDSIHYRNSLTNLINDVDRLILKLNHYNNDSLKQNVYGAFLIHLYLFNAYFYNELIKVGDLPRSFLDLDEIRKNDYYYKIDNIFQALKLYYIMSGMERDDLNILEIFYYYYNYSKLGNDSRTIQNRNTIIRKSKINDFRKIHWNLKNSPYYENEDILNILKEFMIYPSNLKDTAIYENVNIYHANF